MGRSRRKWACLPERQRNLGAGHTFCGGEPVKRHLLELVGATLLCLAAFFSFAAPVPISPPILGTGSGVASNPDRLAPDPVAILQVSWPQFPIFCVGHCTNQE